MRRGRGVRLDNGKTMEYEKWAGLGVRLDNGKTMEYEKHILFVRYAVMITYCTSLVLYGCIIVPCTARLLRAAAQ